MDSYGSASDNSRSDKEMIKFYRKVLKEQFGIDKTPDDIFEEKVRAGKSVSLYSLIGNRDERDFDPDEYLPKGKKGNAKKSRSRG